MAGPVGGSLELPSGRWNWTAEERQGGWFMTFRHATAVLDEMGSWVDAGSLSDAVIRQAALDPVTRRWQDGWGREWEVTVEMGRRSSAGAQHDLYLYLRFSGRGEQYHADVPAGTRLGNLTRGDLARLLKAAGGSA